MDNSRSCLTSGFRLRKMETIDYGHGQKGLAELREKQLMLRTEFASGRQWSSPPPPFLGKCNFFSTRREA